MKKYSLEPTEDNIRESFCENSLVGRNEDDDVQNVYHNWEE